LIKASLENTSIKIKIANAVSETVRVSTGLKQGDALSPVLFNLVLEKIVRELNTIDGVTMGNTTIGLLAYSDDLALLRNNLDTVKENCRKLINVAGKCGLKINDKKTKYVITGRRSREYRQGELMEIDHHKFKRASHFKYLGSIITKDSDLKMEVDTRIQMENKCFFGLGNMFSSKILSAKLKIQLYMTLIRPVVLYGSETWTL
jgi:hypothetical protein